MRQKDADEVARVLGREYRFADVMEKEGIRTAHGALLGHYVYRYPDIDIHQVMDIYKEAASEPPT
jgi:hypothetical protein